MSDSSETSDSNNEEDQVVIKFTSAQKKRWGERIKEAVFDSTEDYVDGSFVGNINSEVLDLIQNNIVTDEVLAVEDYEQRVQTCQHKLIQWIDQKTVGVHILFIMTFVEHFMTVVFSEVFSVTSTDSPEPEDNFFYA